MIYARQGIDLDRSVLTRWVGEAGSMMSPLAEALRRYVMNSDKLHGDDTPLPVLAPGTGKIKTARFWSYVRDNTSAGDKTAPAVWFAYSPDRKGEHPPTASEELSRHSAGGCLFRFPQALRERRHSGSSMHGAHSPQVLRVDGGSSLFHRNRSGGTHCRTVSDRA